MTALWLGQGQGMPPALTRGRAWQRCVLKWTQKFDQDVPCLDHTCVIFRKSSWSSGAIPALCPLQMPHCLPNCPQLSPKQVALLAFLCADTRCGAHTQEGCAGRGFGWALAAPSASRRGPDAYPLAKSSSASCWHWNTRCLLHETRLLLAQATGLGCAACGSYICALLALWQPSYVSTVLCLQITRAPCVPRLRPSACAPCYRALMSRQGKHCKAPQLPRHAAILHRIQVHARVHSYTSALHAWSAELLQSPASLLLCRGQPRVMANNGPRSGPYAATTVAAAAEAAALPKPTPATAAAPLRQSISGGRPSGWCPGGRWGAWWHRRTRLNSW